MIKFCTNCKEKFETENLRKVYCTDKCQRIFYRKSPEGRAAAKKWNNNNKNWWKNYKKTEVWIRLKKKHAKSKATIERYKRYQKTEKYKKVIQKYRSKKIVKIRIKIRGNIGKIFRRLNITKNKTSFKYLGCSINKFKQHIEKQFKPGMSWENHGVYGWHFDHIRPVSSFNFNSKEDIQKCNNYKNFQPMWAEDNLKKSNKLFYERRKHA